MKASEFMPSMDRKRKAQKHLYSELGPDDYWRKIHDRGAAVAKEIMKTKHKKNAPPRPRINKKRGA